MVEEFIDNYGRRKLEKEFENSELFKKALEEQHDITSIDELDYDWTFDAEDNYIYPYFITYVEDNYYSQIYEDDGSDYYYDSWKDSQL